MQRSDLPDWTHFPIISLKIEIALLDSFQLPAFAGSMFRGVLGWALKEVCGPGLYSYLFETSSELPGQSTAARPYILIPPINHRAVKAAQRLNFQLRLLGDGCHYLPEFIDALLLAGDRGLGKKQARFKILKIIANEGNKQWVCFDDNLGWEQSYQPLPCALGSFARIPSGAPSSIQIIFETPTKLVNEGEPELKPSFEVVMRSIYRRLNSLLEVHSKGSEGPSLLNKLEEAKEIESYHRLEWIDWKRTSNRQHKRHSMGGIIGTSQYHGWFLREWIALLTAGEVLNLGKGTTFGMGCYKIIFPGID